MEEKIKQALTDFIIRVANGEAISDKEVDIFPEVVKLISAEPIKFSSKTSNILNK